MGLAQYTRVSIALAVHAKDYTARTFYEHFGFIPSPTDPLHLFVLIKDLQHITAS